MQGIPKRKITDKEELQEYKLKQRKYFEDMIRKNQTSLQSWLRYAAFEAKMKEWQRARSVYERALNGQYKSIPLWIKYTEMECKMAKLIMQETCMIGQCKLCRVQGSFGSSILIWKNC